MDMELNTGSDYASRFLFSNNISNDNGLSEFDSYLELQTTMMTDENIEASDLSPCHIILYHYMSKAAPQMEINNAIPDLEDGMMYTNRTDTKSLIPAGYVDSVWKDDFTLDDHDLVEENAETLESHDFNCFLEFELQFNLSDPPHSPNIDETRDTYGMEVDDLNLVADDFCWDFDPGDDGINWDGYEANISKRRSDNGDDINSRGSGEEEGRDGYCNCDHTVDDGTQQTKLKRGKGHSYNVWDSDLYKEMGVLTAWDILGGDFVRQHILAGRPLCT